MLAEHLITTLIFIGLWTFILARVSKKRKDMSAGVVAHQSKRCPNCNKGIPKEGKVVQKLNGTQYNFCSFECRGHFVKEKWNGK